MVLKFLLPKNKIFFLLTYKNTIINIDIKIIFHNIFNIKIKKYIRNTI